MYLFICHLAEKTESENLIRKAFSIYQKQKGINVPIDPFSVVIEKTKQGKPYFRDLSDAYISVTHSEDFWCCGIDRFPIGIDVEKKEKYALRDPIRWMRLAERFYTNSEQDYVKKYGMEGFLNLWTFKESYIKLRGIGVPGGLKEIEVVKNMQIVETANHCYFHQVTDLPGFVLGICGETPIEIEKMVII